MEYVVIYENRYTYLLHKKMSYCITIRKEPKHMYKTNNGNALSISVYDYYVK